MTCSSAPARRVAGDERFVALHVEDGVEPRIRAVRDFGDAIGAGWVVGGGHDAFAACSRTRCAISRCRSRRRSVGDAERADALPDADDQGESREEAEGLSGETRGAQSCWDDGERLHAEAGPGCNFHAIEVSLLRATAPGTKSLFCLSE